MNLKELPSRIVLAGRRIIIPRHPNARNTRPVTFTCEEQGPVTVFVPRNIPASALENADVLTCLVAQKVTKKIRLN